MWNDGSGLLIMVDAGGGISGDGSDHGRDWADISGDGSLFDAGGGLWAYLLLSFVYT